MRNTRYGRRTPLSSTVRAGTSCLPARMLHLSMSFACCRSGDHTCSRMAQSDSAVAAGECCSLGWTRLGAGKIASQQVNNLLRRESGAKIHAGSRSLKCCMQATHFQHGATVVHQHHLLAC